MAKRKTLKDKNGNIVYPTTKAEVTYMADNSTTVENEFKKYLPLSAGSGKALTGDLYAGTHKIKNVVDGSADGDAVNYGQVKNLLPNHYAARYITIVSDNDPEWLKLADASFEVTFNYNFDSTLRFELHSPETDGKFYVDIIMETYFRDDHMISAPHFYIANKHRYSKWTEGQTRILESLTLTYKYTDDTHVTFEIWCKRPRASYRSMYLRQIWATRSDTDGADVSSMKDTKWWNFEHLKGTSAKLCEEEITPGATQIPIVDRSGIAKKLENYYSSRPTSANLPVDGDGSLVQFKATNSMTEGKPKHDGGIIHMNWDNNDGWCQQISVPTGSVDTPYIAYRTQNEDVWGDWHYLLDDKSYIKTTAAGKTFIDADEDLNTVEFLQPGGYVCETDAKAASLDNCPTNKFFIMDVVNANNSRTVIRETDAWVTIHRTIRAAHWDDAIIGRHSRIFTQMVYKNGSSAQLVYGPWLEVPVLSSGLTSKNLAVSLWSTARIYLTDPDHLKKYIKLADIELDAKKKGDAGHRTIRSVFDFQEIHEYAGERISEVALSIVWQNGDPGTEFGVRTADLEILKDQYLGSHNSGTIGYKTLLNAADNLVCTYKIVENDKITVELWAQEPYNHYRTYYLRQKNVTGHDYGREDYSGNESKFRWNYYELVGNMTQIGSEELTPGFTQVQIVNKSQIQTEEIANGAITPAKLDYSSTKPNVFRYSTSTITTEDSTFNWTTPSGNTYRMFTGNAGTILNIRSGADNVSVLKGYLEFKYKNPSAGNDLGVHALALGSHALMREYSSVLNGTGRQYMQVDRAVISDVGGYGFATAFNSAEVLSGVLSGACEYTCTRAGDTSWVINGKFSLVGNHTSVDFSLIVTAVDTHCVPNLYLRDIRAEDLVKVRHTIEIFEN